MKTPTIKYGKGKGDSYSMSMCSTNIIINHAMMNMTLTQIVNEYARQKGIKNGEIELISIELFPTTGAVK